MNRIFVRNNLKLFAIIIFLITYATINTYKPGFLYNSDGSLRQFGVGQMRKSVIPAWLLAIILAIFSYFGILYYLAAPQLNY